MTTLPSAIPSPFIVPDTIGEARSAGARWSGALDGLHETMLFGWAIDRQRPESRVVLEICLDGEAVGCAVADVARSDIAPADASDCCHGFVAELGAMAARNGGRFTVRIANTAICLPGQVDLAAPPAPPLAATSQVLSDGALRLFGWAIDARHPQRQQKLLAYLDGEIVAQAVANELHPATRGLAEGPHGFSLDLPLALADGREHTIRVLTEDGQALNGSPLTVCCFTGGVKGLLDTAPSPLLDKLIDSYERYLPRSVGMAHYAEWSAMFEAPQAPSPIAHGSELPRIAIVVTGDGDSERTVRSLRSQIDARVEVFCAAGGGRQSQDFSQLLKRALKTRPELIACVRAGDSLPPHALACAAEAFAAPATSVAYTDSQDPAGVPWFKPAWNPEYALCSDFPLDFLVFRRVLLASHLACHGLPAQPAELAWAALCAAWDQGDDAIMHVPRVLYHFHSALSVAERSARFDAARRALLQREPGATLCELPASRDDSDDASTICLRRLQRPLPDIATLPLVSLLIPTRDRVELLRACIDSIGKFTSRVNLEIIVIDNGSSEPASRQYFRTLSKQGIRILPVHGQFNFATLNNRAVAAACGEIVGLINNDIEATHEGWLEEILSHLLQPGVGAVGAKLLWPNGMVQHGGVVLGMGNAAGHFGNLLAQQDTGDHGRNQMVQQVSAVTAACLFLRKADYLAVGGMDALAFPVAFNDVDLCLKLRSAGKSILWTPHAQLLHAESASRGSEDNPQKRARAQRELHQLRQRWGAVLLRDPAYHPSLNLDSHAQAFTGLALPPRDRSPRGASLRATWTVAPENRAAAGNR